MFREQDPVSKLRGACDSDWVGDLTDRKSVSSVHIFHGANMIKSSSTGQAVQALSSGEAEYVSRWWKDQAKTSC